MLGDEVAAKVLDVYASLPAKGKPLVRSNGAKEWTVVAGVVIRVAGKLQCVSLATGVKAQSDAKISHCGGKILHDCHAEILCLRAFNLWCLQSAAEVGGVENVYLYVSAPPCGDASMSLLNGADNWSNEASSSGMLRGRAHFNILGRIRTKPGRADSQLTMSKSCTDKLCLRQTTGILNCYTRHIFRSIYLDALITPTVLPDYERAFSRWSPAHRFSFCSTSQEFPDRCQNQLQPVSPASIVWTPHMCEVIMNGMKNGRYPSAVSRYALVKLAKHLPPQVHHYSDLKTSEKPAGWERTAKDDFLLEC